MGASTAAFALASVPNTPTIFPSISIHSTPETSSVASLGAPLFNQGHQIQYVQRAEREAFDVLHGVPYRSDRGDQLGLQIKRARKDRREEPYQEEIVRDDRGDDDHREGVEEPHPFRAPEGHVDQKEREQVDRILLVHLPPDEEERECQREQGLHDAALGPEPEPVPGQEAGDDGSGDPEISSPAEDAPERRIRDYLQVVEVEQGAPE